MPATGWSRGSTSTASASGAAIEVVASTNADQNVTIRENVLGRHWADEDLTDGPTNRVGVSVQARGVHVGGGTGRTAIRRRRRALLTASTTRRGNYFRGTTGPAST